jgi:hypothetical protein
MPARDLSLEEKLRLSVYQVQQRKRDDLQEWLDAAPVPPKRLKRKRMSNDSISVVEKPKSIARVTDDQGVSVDVVVARVEKVREVQKRIMKLDTHYGKVPGTSKDCLLKPGAEILGLTFQLGPSFKTEDRWDGEHLESVVTCTLNHIPTGNPVTSAVGSCSTKEKKYAWRSGGRKCPSCGSTTALMKSKDKPEFFCWRKKDGCGATFPEKDERITSQSVGRVPNPDLADNYNTVRKMACKRAHVAAILFATCASEIFTQDIEDSDEMDHGSGGSSTQHGAYPDEDPEAARANIPAFDEVMKLIGDLENEVKVTRTVTADDLSRWRQIFGSKGNPSKLVGERIRAFFDDLAPVQRDELGKASNRLERQLKRYEGIVQAAPKAERQPGEDDDL